MPGMVFPQLLTPETGLDRPAPDRSSGADKAAGGSRYDEVARQQEQRLESRREQLNADRRSAEADRQQEKLAADRQEQAAANERRRDASGEPDRHSTAEVRDRASDNDRASDKDKPVESADSSGERSTEGVSKSSGTDSGGSASDAATPAAGADSGVTAGADDTVEPFALFGVGRQDSQSAPGQASAITFKPATQPGTGLPGNGPTSSSALFSKLLEGSTKPAGSASELISGLQGQGLADGAGKSAELINGQAVTRFAGALELAGQQLNPPGGIKGAEAQALMRSYSTSVDVPVAADEWGEKVMGKLAWLTASQMSVAEIHVTPADLGPLDVRVQVQNDQATVTVHSPTPAVREQLELHGHRLRDMLSEQGITLDGFDVSDSGPRDSSGETGDGQAGNGADGAGEQEQGSAIAAGELDLSWKGEVDLYA